MSPDARQTLRRLVDDHATNVRARRRITVLSTFREIYRIANVNYRVRFKGYPELSSPIISLEIVPTRESCIGTKRR